MTILAGILVCGAMLVLGAFGLALVLRSHQRRGLRERVEGRGLLVLTYDDGPGERLTPDLLALLEQYSAKATFFALGRDALERGAILDRIQSEGHEIGCHSRVHANAWKAMPWKGVLDAAGGFKALARWIPQRGGLYRPPFGKIDLLTLLWLKVRGARLAWWTLDAGDTHGERPAPEDVVGRVVTSGGGVVLLHDFDGSPERSRFVLETTQRLLEAARERGWSVCTMGECLDRSRAGPPHWPSASRSPVVAGEMGAKADGLICYAGVDWWYHNRGHSECQIVRRIAADAPVLWVNSIGMRMPRVGKSELTWTRYLRKLKSTFRSLRRDESGMWVYSPLFIPGYTPRLLRVNGWLLHLQTAVIARAIGIRSPSVFITLPTAAQALRHRGWVKRVFNRSDRFSEFPEVDRDVVAECEEELFRVCDEVLYVSRSLMESETDRVRRAHFIDHGVDFEHFAHVRSDRGMRGAAPDSIAALPRPIVGFYGALDDYTIDLELMIDVARAIPDGTLLVIGPRAMEIDALLAEPNVTYLGPVPYADLPRHAAVFDVGIMPWLRNDWIEACNPIKLKEYLALGFPVVSTRFPEVEAYEELIGVADDRDGFVALVRQALDGDIPNGLRRRQERVRHASWSALSQRVSELLSIDSTEGAA